MIDAGAGEVARLASAMQARGLDGCEVALVLGSGLSALAGLVSEATSVPFEELPDMPCGIVPGHAGRFLRGRLGGREVLVQLGRVHLYEGWSAGAVARSVRAVARLGARVLLLTNAAGGLDPRRPVPRLMLVDDHLNRQGRTPLAPREAGRGCPYDERLGNSLERAARAAGVELERGTYAGLLGPSYETPAEIRFLATCGVRAVGMSTVAEALAGHAAGLSVAALSVITNHAAGIDERPLAHEEVLEAGARIVPDLGRLIEHAVSELPAR